MNKICRNIKICIIDLIKNSCLLSQSQYHLTVKLKIQLLTFLQLFHNCFSMFSWRLGWYSPQLDDAMGLTPVQEDEWAPLVSPDITQVHTAGFSHMPWYYLLVSVRINTLYRHFFTVVWGFFVLTKYCIQIYFFSQNETINLFSVER